MVNKKEKSDLQRNAERIQSLIENSAVAIYCFEVEQPIDIGLPINDQLDLIHRHASIAEANDTYAKIAGFGRGADMKGLHLSKIMPRELPENVTQLKRLIRANYNLTHVESIEVYPTGTEKILLNDVVGIIKDGCFFRAWRTGVDITEIRATEQKLKAAEQRYRMMADFTYDWEYWESPKGEMLYVSPSCERISGYPPEAFEKHPDLIHEIILSEDKRVWAAHTHQATSKPGPLIIAFRIRTREGEVRWIEHACQPVHDAKGTFLGFRASNRDITSRKVAEEELQRKDEMLEDAQRIARLGSWDWDILTNKLKWSDEVYRIFGLSSHTFGATYETFLQCVHPEDREDVKAAVNRSLDDPSAVYNIVHRIKRPDGSERIVRERAQVIFDDNTGKASRMIGTVQDITDIREMETEAERLRSELSRMDRVNMMGVLTAGIAHEINQPLAAILSNAQASLRLMNRDPQELEEVKEALRDIISDDKRAGEMVHSIRNIVGKYDLKLQEIDLNETAREVLLLVKSEALNSNLVIYEDLQPDIPPVNGDRIQIQQVILNLVMNALEALKGHHISTPEVIVSTRFGDNKEVLLSVSDSGPGIKPDQLNTIFDSFETTKKGGLGIGLSICRSIAQRLGGRLWAENRPEGGAIFFFSLPLSG